MQSTCLAHCILIPAMAILGPYSLTELMVQGTRELFSNLRLYVNGLQILSKHTPDTLDGIVDLAIVIAD